MALALPDDLNSLIGSVITNDDEEYHVKDYRGSGKRGHVFRAELKGGRIRALKFVAVKKLDRGNWHQEIYKAHRLEQQPNTVRFYRFFYHDNYGVMVFDYIDGTSLKEKAQLHELTVGDVQRILENLLIFRQDCLNIETDLRHGDLHPGNIILKKPVMGTPRAYEVLITDFGIGHTGAVLRPKDDFSQIGDIVTMMLQSITREHLDQSDRVVYDELCHGIAIKNLREHSPLERGEEKGAIQRLLDELTQITTLTSMPESSTIRYTRFGDYLAGEQLGNRWKEWKDLFVSSFPGYDDIVSRNTTVLTGTRGCGKTMVFRRLSTLLAFEVGPVDAGAAGALVGIYLNMNDIADAFLFDRQKSLQKDLAMRIIQFFHLSLLSEIARVAAVAREKAIDKQKTGYDKANRWLFNFVVKQMDSKQLYPGSVLEMRVAGSVIERAKDEIRHSKKSPDKLKVFAQNDWLKRFVPELQKKMPWISQKPVYFFLDDYSLPRVNEALQKVLNSVIFQRSDCFFFKISTESPSTLYLKDYSNKTLDYTHDFELTDLGSVTIDLPDDTRERFLDDVFQRRFARDKRFQNKGLAEVLGTFEMKWTELARRIRGESEQSVDNVQFGGIKSRSVLYYGREVFVNMWSGDTRSMVKIAQGLLEQLPMDDIPPELPINPKLQNKVFRDTGGEFLHLLRACTMTARENKIMLPNHITSWGEHLVKIAEAFKEIAVHELRTRQGGRKNRNEPKQAFRIEIVDDFSLTGIEKELYEDLVRYGVFLRDDRGKSIRGAIIPRLYLRRLLIPYCTLTFSKIDNISMNSSAFKKLLMAPQEFMRNWKKNRTPFVLKQKEFEF